MQTTRGWPDYHARFARVMTHIHDHLADDLDLDRLADLAHLSSFHWHRIWHACYGETLAATVRRLRMLRASGWLANSTLSVAAIGRRCGYPQPRSFVRAFQAEFGATPAAWRVLGPERRSRLAGHGEVDSAGLEQGATHKAGLTTGATGLGGFEARVSLRDVPLLRLAGLDHRGSYMGVGKAFEVAFAHLHGAGLMGPETQGLAAYLDDPFSVAESRLRSRAGWTLPEGASAPAPLVEFNLGGCQCAVLRWRGPYADMRAAYQWLYGEWLPASGFEPLDQPVFEAYLNNPRDVAPHDLMTDILLPVGAACPS